MPADTVCTLHRQCSRLLDSVRNLKTLSSAKRVATNLLSIVYELFVIQPNNKKKAITLIAPSTLLFYVQYWTYLALPYLFSYYPLIDSFVRNIMDHYNSLMHL